MSFDLDRIGGRRALARLIDEVCAAGEDALRLYREGAASRAERKADASPVTEADRAVEARLRGFLQTLVPEAGFLGEESGGAEGSDLRFVVDPIDGTRAFIRGIPTWSVLVGLESSGEPAVGVALFPADGDLLVGVRGDGATLNGRPLRVSTVAEVADTTISHGGLHQFTDSGMGHLLARLGERTFTQRGFTDFDGYRQLLLGRVDAMVDPGVKPWDICPAAVLVNEAGGRFSAMSGKNTIHEGTSLATNGLVHDAFLELLRD